MSYTDNAESIVPVSLALNRAEIQEQFCQLDFFGQVELRMISPNLDVGGWPVRHSCFDEQRPMSWNQIDDPNKHLNSEAEVQNTSEGQVKCHFCIESDVSVHQNLHRWRCQNDGCPRQAHCKEENEGHADN